MKKDQKITVIEYVHGPDGREVRIDELGPEDYERFRQWMITTWAGVMLRGKAEVHFEAIGISANSAESPVGSR